MATATPNMIELDKYDGEHGPDTRSATSGQSASPINGVVDASPSTDSTLPDGGTGYLSGSPHRSTPC